MSDTRSHRGPDPRDRDQFAPPQWARLREAVADLSWLRGRGYAERSALKLVGDRWALTERQRLAVRRSACSDGARARRLAHRVVWTDLAAQPLWIDGFNVLTTIEAALGGAVILRGRDGCDRDLAGVHGTYRKVEETRPAAALVGGFLAAQGLGPCVWFLDRPVSNSGRLRSLLLDIAQREGWNWRVELAFNPDAILRQATVTVATSDSAILDHCQAWANLAHDLIATQIPSVFLVDLSLGGRATPPA